MHSLHLVQQVLQPPSGGCSCFSTVRSGWLTLFLCYVDESGDEQALRTKNDPPVLALGGLVVEEARCRRLIWDFLQLKKRYNPVLARPDSKLSDLIAFEMKGSNLRADMRSDSRRRRRRAFGILDKLLELLDEHNVSLISEVHIKGQKVLSRWVYVECVAGLAEKFDAQLRAAGTTGLMILDARTKAKNVPSVQRITTKRFKSGDNGYTNLVESPVFGHSDAHVVLQIVDIVVSAMLFPMACAGFCLCLLDNAHPSSAYLEVRERYGQQLRHLEYRYLDSAGTRVGGVRVHDHMNRQPTLALFQDVPFRIGGTSDS